MKRFTLNDILVLALFLVLLFSGTAATYFRWFSSRGVDGIVRDFVDETLHPTKGKSEPTP